MAKGILQKNIFLTSSSDNNIHLWDIYGKQFGIDSEIAQKNIIKIKTTKNKKIPVNCCTFNLDGKIIIGSVNDGSNSETKLPFDPCKSKTPKQIKILYIVYICFRYKIS